MQFPRKDSPDGAPQVLTLENTLRKKIGANVALNKIFTPEKMRQCQQLIDSTHDGFIAEMETQLVTLGEESMHAIADPSHMPSTLAAISDISLVLQNKMESLGFAFGFEVAKSLHEYIGHIHSDHGDVMLIVCKHVAVLNVILKDRIRGDGGPMGQEMLRNLKKLIRKNDAAA